MFIREVTIICKCDYCGKEKDVKHRESLDTNYQYKYQTEGTINLPHRWAFVDVTQYRPSYHDSLEKYVGKSLRCPDCIAKGVNNDTHST